MTDPIPLKHPFTLGERRYENVTLRRAKAKDMRLIAPHLPALMRLAEAAEGADSEEAAARKAALQFDGPVVDAMITLAATLGDLGEAAEELDFEDLVELANRAGDFLSVGGTSGAKSAPNVPQS